jgi:hypothetical protein
MSPRLEESELRRRAIAGVRDLGFIEMWELRR